MYNKLIEEKDFKVDPNIFKDQYDLLIEKVYQKKKRKRMRKNQQNKNQMQKKREENKKKRLKRKKKDQIYITDIKKKQKEINNYYNKLKFYEYIESYSSSKYNIDIDYQYENNLKNDYNNKIKDYYYNKKEEKKQQLQNKITEAYNKTAIQSYGVMECVNGHKFSGNGVGCGNCNEKGYDFDDRLLVWVDVDEH